MRAHYDFQTLRGVVRGKYAVRFKAGVNLIHLEPDVAKVFVDDVSVNEALRSLIKIAKAQTLHVH